MKPEDIGALVDVSDPRVSPDGSQVAFVVTTIDLDKNEYRARVWVAVADGSSPPRPFTSGESRDGKPRWSPDGSQLAFVSHREEKGSALYVLPVSAGGEAARIASSPEEIDDLEWSPDGRLIAYGTRVRAERLEKEKPKDQPPRRISNLYSRVDTVGWTIDRPRHLHVVPSDGSAKPAQLTDGRDVGGLTWSPDAKSLAFTSGRHGSWDLDRAVDIFVVDAVGGEPRRVTTTGPSYSRPSWGTSGIAFAFTPDPSIAPTHGHTGVMAPDGSGERLLTTSLDRQCSVFGVATKPVWDAGDVLFLVEDSGNVYLYRVPADGSGKPESVLSGERSLKGFDMRGGTLAFVASQPTALTELIVSDEDGSERKLTRFGESFASKHTLSSAERFTATSADGSEVEAWVMKPVGFEEGKRYPALLNIHGGPFTQYGNTFFDEFQMETGAGYVVVFSNPRGSSGYSQAWGRATRGPVAKVAPGSGWGGVDYEDLMAVVDEAVARFDFIEPDRLGVMGGSYGGYMTSWIVGHTDRFKAACSERAVNNVLTLEWGSDAAGSFRSWIGASHLEAPEEYLRQSPITYVRDIKTPLLIVHSDDDWRCPVEQADQLFVTLRMLERDVELVRFPAESHELSRSGSPRHRVQRMELILEFFDKHLKA